jgi:hypothetical protein
LLLPGSGAVGMSHMDGAGTEEGVQIMIQRVQELAIGYPDGRLELQLVGGFTGSGRNYSEELFSSIMSKFIFSKYLRPFIIFFFKKNLKYSTGVVLITF